MNKVFSLRRKFEFEFVLPDDRVKKLDFKLVEISDITYGFYPTIMRVRLFCENGIKIAGTLSVDEKLKPEFRFADFVNDQTDRELLSKKLYIIYCMKAVSLFYGNNFGHNKNSFIIGKNLEWLRNQKGYSLKQASRLLNIDDRILRKIESSKSTFGERKSLDFNLIKKIYGTLNIAIPTRFLIDTEFKPLLTKLS